MYLIDLLDVRYTVCDLRYMAETCLNHWYSHDACHTAKRENQASSWKISLLYVWKLYMYVHVVEASNEPEYKALCFIHAHSFRKCVNSKMTWLT